MIKLHLTRSRRLHRYFQTIMAGIIFGAGIAAIPAYAETYTVTITANDGAGSLRDAINQANADPGSNILFDISAAGLNTANPVFTTPADNPLPALSNGTILSTNDSPGLSSITINGNVVNEGSSFAINNGAIGGDLSATDGGHSSIMNGQIDGNAVANGALSSGVQSLIDIENVLVGTVTNGVLADGTGDLRATNGAIITASGGSSILGNVISDGTASDKVGSAAAITDSTVGNILSNGRLQENTGNISATNGGVITATDATIYGDATADGAGSLIHISNSEFGTFGIDDTLTDGGNINVTNGAQVEMLDGWAAGNATVSGDSTLSLFDSELGNWIDDGAQAGTGNLTASDDAKVLLSGNSFVDGDVLFRDSATLNINGWDGAFNNSDENIGTTTFQDNASLLANVWQSSPVSDVNNLVIKDNATLRPQFDLSNPIPVYSGNNSELFPILTYSAASGEFNIASPLSVAADYGNLEPNTLSIYLTDNAIDYTKMPGNRNEKALGKYISDYVNSLQAPGEFNLGNAPALTGDVANLLGQASLENQLGTVTEDGNLGSFSAIAQQFEPYSHFNQLAYWNQLAFVNVIRDQLNNVENMADGNSNFAFNLNAGMTDAPSQLAALQQMTAPRQVGLYATGESTFTGASNGVWAAYNGSHQRIDADAGTGSSEWSSSTDGFTLGYMGGGNKFTWGAATGHQKSTFSVGDTKQEGWNGALYGKLRHGRAYLSGIAGYGNYRNNYQGFIGDNSFKNKTTSIAAEIGTNIIDNRTSKLAPYFSVLWAKIKQNDAALGSGGTLLKGTSNHVLTTELGARYNRRVFDKVGALKGGWLVGLAWLHQGDDTNLASVFAFDGISGAFAVQGTPLSGNAAVARLGVYGRIHRNVVGYAGYQGTFGNNQKINGVNAGVGYQF